MPPVVVVVEPLVCQAKTGVLSVRVKMVRSWQPVLWTSISCSAKVPASSRSELVMVLVRFWLLTTTLVT